MSATQGWESSVYYFWGRPCSKGHIGKDGLTKRYLSNRKCAECRHTKDLARKKDGRKKKPIDRPGAKAENSAVNLQVEPLKPASFKTLLSCGCVLEFDGERHVGTRCTRHTKFTPAPVPPPDDAKTDAIVALIKREFPLIEAGDDPFLRASNLARGLLKILDKS